MDEVWLSFFSFCSRCIFLLVCCFSMVLIIKLCTSMYFIVMVAMVKYASQLDSYRYPIHAHASFDNQSVLLKVNNLFAIIYAIPEHMRIFKQN